MRTHFVAIAWGAGGALVTVILTFLVVHAWNDHAALHQVIGYINEHAAAINALPAAAAPAR